MMRIRAFVVVLIAFLMPFGLVANAAGVESGNQSSLVIVVDSADFYPYYYRENGKLVGPMPEVTDAVLSSMGYSIEFQEVPWARAVDLVTRRQVDAITGIFYRRDRESFLHYPQQYPAESLLSLMVPTDSDLAFDGDLSVLEGRDIGAVLGWTYGLFEQTSKIGRIDFGDEGVLVRNVAQGRIGIGIGNPTSLARYATNQNMGDRVRVLKPPVESTPLYTAFSKKPGHEDLAQRFSAALAVFKETQLFHEIMRRHGLE